MRKNYKSDFLLMLHLYNAAGAEIGFPTFDWCAEFFTFSPSKTFKASSKGGIMENCRDEKGCICVVFDSHGLLSGKLKVLFTALIPSEYFPDGSADTVCRCTLPVELTPDADDGVRVLHASIILPVEASGGGGGECGCEELTEEELLEIIGSGSTAQPVVPGDGCGGDCGCEELSEQELLEIINPRQGQI